MANQKACKLFLSLIHAIERRNMEAEGFDKVAVIEFTIGEAKSYFMHGEEGLAIEVLVDNLYEFQFPMDKGILDTFSQLGNLLGIDEQRWLILKELVRSDRV